MYRVICKQNLQLFQNILKFYSNTTLKKSDLVLTSRQEHVYLIGINRPERRNSVNIETATVLKKSFQDFENDDNAYVAILHGVGGTFCAGYDLQQVSNGIFPDIISDGPMGPSRYLLKKPVIAAVDGHAVAGGMELALWCDLRVMEETAHFGVLCRRFGVPLIDGGTVRLPHLIGLGRALDLILTGRKIDGKEAYEMGLVTKLCKKGEALSKAIELANSLCEMQNSGITLDKNTLYKDCYYHKQ